MWSFDCRAAGCPACHSCRRGAESGFQGGGVYLFRVEDGPPHATRHAPNSLRLCSISCLAGSQPTVADSLKQGWWLSCVCSQGRRLKRGRTGLAGFARPSCDGQKAFCQSTSSCVQLIAGPEAEKLGGVCQRRQHIHAAMPCSPAGTRSSLSVRRACELTAQLSVCHQTGTKE